MAQGVSAMHSDDEAEENHRLATVPSITRPYQLSTRWIFLHDSVNLGLYMARKSEDNYSQIQSKAIVNDLFNQLYDDTGFRVMFRNGFPCSSAPSLEREKLNRWCNFVLPSTDNSSGLLKIGLQMAKHNRNYTLPCLHDAHTEEGNVTESFEITVRGSPDYYPGFADDKSNQVPLGGQEEMNIVSLCEFNRRKVKEDDLDANSFETWDNWFRAIMSMKSITVATQLLSDEGILQCFYKCMSHHCLFATNDAETFASHLKEIHCGQETMFCCYCLRAFEDAELLAGHMTPVHGSRRYQCSRCPYRAYSKNHLLFHSNDFHSADYFSCPQPVPTSGGGLPVLRDIKQYRCTIDGCRYTTIVSQAFWEHARMQHRGVPTYSCCYCDFETPQVSCLLSHYSRHGMHEFECAHCDYGNSSASHIIRHLCLMHPDQNLALFTRRCEEETSRSSVPEFVPNHARNLSCPFCHFKAWNVAAYRKHQSETHRGCAMPCPHCSRKFGMSHDLEEHVHMHGPNLYRCSCCGFLHWLARMLKDHLLREHGMRKCRLLVVRELQEALLAPIATLTGDDVSKELPVVLAKKRKYACSHCDEVARSKKGMLFHYRKFHLYRRAVHCFLCREIFSSNGVLSFHVELDHSSRAVNTKRTIWCFACRYHTQNSGHMKEHLFSEMGYLPFRCTICGFGSKRKAQIVQHIRNSHCNARGSWTQRADPHIEEWVRAYYKAKTTKAHEKQTFSSDGGFICVICRDILPSVRRYRLHLFRHLQYKRYSCPSCDAKFVGKSSARKHSVGVHGLRPKRPRPTLRVAWVEDWVAEKLTAEGRAVPTEGFSHYGKLPTPLSDLSHLYFYMPCPAEIRVSVLDGFKYMKLEVRVQVERCNFPLSTD